MDTTRGDRVRAREKTASCTPRGEASGGTDPADTRSWTSSLPPGCERPDSNHGSAQPVVWGGALFQQPGQMDAMIP